MVEAQERTEKNGNEAPPPPENSAVSLQDLQRLPEITSGAANIKSAQNTVESEFGTPLIDGDGKLDSAPERGLDPSELGAALKGQDLSKFGIDGKFYPFKDGEIMILDNGVKVVTKDGKTEVVNGEDAPKVKTDVTDDNGTQTITYEDGTVIKMKDGRLVSVSQNEFSLERDEDGNLHASVDKKTVAFIDLDQDGDLEAFPVHYLNGEKIDQRPKPSTYDDIRRPWHSQPS